MIYAPRAELTQGHITVIRVFFEAKELEMLHWFMEWNRACFLHFSDEEIALAESRWRELNAECNALKYFGRFE